MKSIKAYKVCFIFFFIFNKALSQQYYNYFDCDENPNGCDIDYDFRFGITNVLIGGIIGGVGSVINRQEHSIGKSLLKGFAIGATGGFVQWQGKKLLAKVNTFDNAGYALPARMVFFAGNSLVENASANVPFWSRWHLVYLNMRMDLDFRSESKFRLRFMPTATAGILYNSFYGNRVAFSLGKSLLTGSFIFEAEDVNAYAYFNGITTTRIPQWVQEDGVFRFNYYQLAHELNHTFQNSSFSGANFWYDKWLSKKTSKINWINHLSKWLYWDTEYFNSFIFNLPQFIFYNYEDQYSELESFWIISRNYRED